MRNAILLITLAAAAAAQTAEGTGKVFPQRMKQNEEALHQYSFKRRTKIEIKGHTRTREELVRYVDGKREAVPLDGSQPQQAQQPHGRGGLLRGALMKQKKQEVKEDVEQLQNLMRSYLSAEALRSAMQKGAVSRSGEGADARLLLSAKGVVQPGDAVTLTWNVAARRPEKIEIAGQVDGKPATATVEYADLPDGPFYAAHTRVSAPKKNIDLIIDTYDYTRGSDAR